MKANGLKLRISYAMSVVLEIYTDDVAKEERIAVNSPLGPKQIENLRVLVEAYGWHLAYERVPTHHYRLFLAILPNQEKEE